MRVNGILSLFSLCDVRNALLKVEQRHALIRHPILGLRVNVHLLFAQLLPFSYLFFM